MRVMSGKGFSESEYDSALDELSPLRVGRIAPRRVALGLRALANRNPLGDLEGGAPDPGPDGGQRRGSGDGGVNGAALHRHTSGVGLELEQGRISGQAAVHPEDFDRNRLAYDVDHV